VLHQSGWLVANLGRFDEGIALARRAVEQDPLSAPAYFSLGLVLWTAARRAEAVSALRKALELAPQYAAAHAWLSIVLLEQGENDEALAEALHEPEEWGRLFALAVIHHAGGRQAESNQALDELTQNGVPWPHIRLRKHTRRVVRPLSLFSGLNGRTISVIPGSSGPRSTRSARRCAVASIPAQDGAGGLSR